MTLKTLKISSIDSYLACEDDSPEARDFANREREDRLHQFPYAVMLEWPFRNSTPRIAGVGNALAQWMARARKGIPEYKACSDETEHRHIGKWTSHWFVKTDYDFGYNEFYFVEQADRDLFLAHLSDIHWGEHYPK